MMKKKPPPGATLIARLKEQRLAREAEIARRQSGGADSSEQPDAPQSAEQPIQQPVQQPVEQPIAHTIEHVDATVVSEQKPVEKPSATEPQASEPETVRTESIEPKPVKTKSQHSQQMVVRSGNGKAAQDLLHREIDIEDLRPTTDDYFVLTDEIRLAGRFAAVGLIAQGLRLSRLKHDAIYKDHYSTFEDYCRKEHQMSATYAYRLIRMSEMAERMAEIGAGAVTAATGAMPDPFEVMLSLGHRHLMALLPLEPETAQELLLRGIPVADQEPGADERVPISRATEKQIREALRVFAGEPATVKVVPKKALATEKQLIPALSKLVEMLEDWSLWLGGEPPAELEAARMGRGQLLNRLAKRFRTASGKIADALEGDEK